MTELRLNTICSFYSFIEYLEFFRIDFGINLSSFRKNEGREFRGLWEERTCISLAWSPRTAAALLTQKEALKAEKRALPPSNCTFPSSSAPSSLGTDHAGKPGSQSQPAHWHGASTPHSGFIATTSPWAGVTTLTLQMRKRRGTMKPSTGCCVCPPPCCPSAHRPTAMALAHPDPDFLFPVLLQQFHLTFFLKMHVYI